MCEEKGADTRHHRLLGQGADVASVEAQTGDGCSVGEGSSLDPLDCGVSEADVVDEQSREGVGGNLPKNLWLKGT